MPAFESTANQSSVCNCTHSAMNVEEAEKKLGELGLSTRAQSKTRKVATISKFTKP